MDHPKKMPDHMRNDACDSDVDDSATSSTISGSNPLPFSSTAAVVAGGSVSSSSSGHANAPTLPPGTTTTFAAAHHHQQPGQNNSYNSSHSASLPHHTFHSHATRSHHSHHPYFGAASPVFSASAPYFPSVSLPSPSTGVGHTTNSGQIPFSPLPALPSPSPSPPPTPFLHSASASHSNSNSNSNSLSSLFASSAGNTAYWDPSASLSSSVSGSFAVQHAQGGAAPPASAATGNTNRPPWLSESQSRPAGSPQTTNTAVTLNAPTRFSSSGSGSGSGSDSALAGVTAPLTATLTDVYSSSGSNSSSNMSLSSADQGLATSVHAEGSSRSYNYPFLAGHQQQISRSSAPYAAWSTGSGSTDPQLASQFASAATHALGTSLSLSAISSTPSATSTATTVPLPLSEATDSPLSPLQDSRENVHTFGVVHADESKGATHGVDDIQLLQENEMHNGIDEAEQEEVEVEMELEGEEDDDEDEEEEEEEVVVVDDGELELEQDAHEPLQDEQVLAQTDPHNTVLMARSSSVPVIPPIPLHSQAKHEGSPSSTPPMWPSMQASPEHEPKPTVRLSLQRKRKTLASDNPQASTSKSKSVKKKKALTPQSLQIRRKKHKEIELNRRRRMNHHFQELDDLCFKDEVPKQKRKDKDAILVMAIRTLRILRDRLHAIEDLARNGSLQLNNSAAQDLFRAGLLSPPKLSSTSFSFASSPASTSNQDLSFSSTESPLGLQSPSGDNTINATSNSGNRKKTRKAASLKLKAKHAKLKSTAAAAQSPRNLSPVATDKQQALTAASISSLSPATSSSGINASGIATLTLKSERTKKERRGEQVQQQLQHLQQHDEQVFATDRGSSALSINTAITPTSAGSSSMANPLLTAASSSSSVHVPLQALHTTTTTTTSTAGVFHSRVPLLSPGGGAAYPACVPPASNFPITTNTASSTTSSAPASSPSSISTTTFPSSSTPGVQFQQHHAHQQPASWPNAYLDPHDQYSLPAFNLYHSPSVHQAPPMRFPWQSPSTTRDLFAIPPNAGLTPVARQFPPLTTADPGSSYQEGKSANLVGARLCNLVSPVTGGLPRNSSSNLFESFGMWAIHLDGRIFLANNFAIRVLGYPSDQFQNGSSKQLSGIALTHPHDLPMYFDALNQLLSNKKRSVVISKRMRHSNGAYLSFHMLAIVTRDENHIPLGYECVFCLAS